MVDNAGRVAGQLIDLPGEIQDADLAWIPEIDRLILRHADKSHDSFDKITDIAECPGLGTIAVDRERLTPQGLSHKVGHNPTIVQHHARAVGVKNPNDSRINLVDPMIGHGNRLGKAFGLIIHGARADAAYVAPVALGLGMDLGVAVDFGGGCEEERGVVGFCQSQAVVGAQAAYFQSLYLKLGVALGAGRRRKVHHHIDRPVNRNVPGNVVLDELKPGLIQHVLDISQTPRDQVVDGHDLVAFTDEAVAQVGSNEAGPARNHNAHGVLPRWV